MKIQAGICDFSACALTHNCVNAHEKGTHVTSSQSYNRYSYCWNNPCLRDAVRQALKFVDPSGYYTIDIDGLQFQSHSLSYLAGVFGNDNVESIYSRGYDNKPIQFREVVNSYTYYDPIPKYLGSGESINDYRHTVTNRYYYAMMGLEGDPPTGRKGFSNTQIIPPKLNVNNLYVSQRGIDFIISFEGAFHSQSYDATGKGDWTIGWGHKIKQGEHFSNITVDDGRKLFEKDLKETIDQINYYVEVPLSQNQYDALVSYVFNAGSGNVFVSSKGVTRNFLNALNNGNYSEACSQMDIVTQPGHVVRRQKERVLWTFGTYNYGY